MYRSDLLMSTEKMRIGAIKNLGNGNDAGLKIWLHDFLQKKRKYTLFSSDYTRCLLLRVSQIQCYNFTVIKLVVKNLLKNKCSLEREWIFV